MSATGTPCSRFFFSSRRRHTIYWRDWSSDVCSSDLFTDVTNQAGLGSSTQLLGWGAIFVDVDNDGWPDIFLANGHVYPEVDGKGFRTTFRERKALYLNQRNGRFKDISQSSGPGISALFNSHGVATADFDNDGAIEILVNNSHARPSLLKNLGEHQNWLIVKLIG